MKYDEVALIVEELRELGQIMADVADRLQAAAGWQDWAEAGTCGLLLRQDLFRARQHAGHLWRRVLLAGAMCDQVLDRLPTFEPPLDAGSP